MFSSKKKSPVPGVPVIPDGTWYGGHLHMMQEPDFKVSIRKFSIDHANEEGRCTFWMGPATPSLSVTHYEDVQTLLKASSHRELFPIMGRHMEQFFGRYNLAVLTGTEWKQKRAAIVKALHGHKVLQHNQEAFRQAVTTLSDRLQEEDFVPDILQVLKMMTLDAFGLATLHTDFGCCRELKPSTMMEDFEFMSTEVMRRMSKDILNPASHLYSLPTAANRRHDEVMTRMGNFISGIVTKRRQLLLQKATTTTENDNDDIPQDLLTFLIRNADDNGDSDGDGDDHNEDEVSEKMLADTIKSIMFAGYETSSVTLTFVLYLLSQHASMEDHCLKEILTTSRPEQEQPEDDLVYVEAVIKEALRLYPPVISTTRSLEKNTKLGDLDIPKGMYLYFPIWIIQRHERHFPEPLKFLPERWARWNNDDKKWHRREFDDEEDGATVPAGNPQAFVAFSAGARSCAGRRFAMQEMKTALSILLKRYRFEPPKDYVLELCRDGLVQCPKGGIPMKIIKRSN